MCMKVKDQVITSLIDNDLYTFTVGQIAFNSFPSAKVKYKFINRGKTNFPKNFAKEIRHQLKLMSKLRFTQYENVYLKSLGYFTDEYLTWLSHYQFNPNELVIKQNGGNLTIEICGIWVRTIMWEVPLLALISELYYKMTNKRKVDGWLGKITQKAQNLSSNGCLWIDFGTRRRFDFETQQSVVFSMKSYKGFLGTSNVLLAFQNSVPPNGTMSHQGPMAMMARYGAKYANKMWMTHWLNFYKVKLLTYLPDTFTTEVFLRDFANTDAVVWDLRQDSGDPVEWMETILAHYKMLNIPTNNKKFIFSDGLSDESYIKLSLKYRKHAIIIGGIGTSISNDCGHPPLSIVIKLSSANFGLGWVDVVKLSDSKGKYTGTKKAVELVKKQLGI